MILAIMSLELQTQHGNIDNHIIIMHIKELFDATNRIKRNVTCKRLFYYKMREDSSMNIHVLRMIDYFRIWSD